MKIRLGKITFVSACTLGLIVSLASTSNAGLIPWLYQTLFGPAYGPGYSGAAYSCAPSHGVPVQANYCAPRCGPTGCSPTFTYYAPYYAAPRASQCQASATDPKQPIPEPPIEADTDVAPPATPPKTFVDKPPMPKQVDAAKTEDEGFRPRTKPDDAKKETAPLETDAFKVPDTVIPEKKPAPVKSPFEDFDKTATPPKPATPEIDPKALPELDKQPGTSRLPAPAIDFDGKVAWRFAPKRTRVSLRANFATPVVARQNVDVNRDWTPVVTSATVAGK